MKKNHYSMVSIFLWVWKCKTLLVMRLTILICLFFALQSIATETLSQNQRVSINQKNVRIEDVIQLIENKTDYYFMYSAKTVDVERTVDIEAANKLVPEILDDIFKGTNVSYKIDGRLIALSKNGEESGLGQQPHSVSGKVTDSTGAPLPGVSVVVKGTTNGVITDNNGNYSLSTIPLNAILQFSFVGMKGKEVAVGEKTSINVVLAEETIGIEEVVAVGYGTQRKIDVTGSIATVSGTELKTSPAKDVASALVGRLPGIISVDQGGVPGQKQSSISIRGYDNMLIIVDGVEYPFSWDQIEMSDVESISILKDAAASIYGARAGNGVLLLTTKHGKKGVAPTFNFNASYGVESPIRRAHTVDAPTFATMTNEVGLSSWTMDQIQKFREGTDPAYPNTDWYNEVYNKTAPLVHYNLNSSGGSDKLNYFYSLGYFINDGLLKSGDLSFKRFNFRSNIQSKFGNGFTGSIDVAGRQEKLSAPGARSYQQGNLNDVIYTVNEDVNFAQPTFAAHNPDPTKLAFGGHGGSSPIGRSSSEWAGYTNDDTKYLDASLNLKYDAPFLSGLSASARLTTNNSFSYIKQFRKEFYCYLYDVTTSTYGDAQLAQATTSDRETMSRYSKLTSQFQVNYENTFGNHKIGAMIVGEFIDNANNNLMGYRQNYISTSVQQLFAGGDKDKDVTGYADQDGRIGYAGRVNYAFADKYLAQLTVRYDGSSRYAAAKRWGTFPSLSLGWRMSEESFLKNISAINNLKLRASIGKAGDDADVPAYAYLTGYNYASDVWGGGQVFGNTIYQGIRTTGLPNPNLIWRTSTNYETGLDGDFWENLLSLEFNLFYRKVEHVAGQRTLSIPSTFGAGLPEEPINSFDNRGFELSLKHENTIGKLMYSIGGMLTYARGRWIHYDEPVYADAETKARLGYSGQWMNRFLGYTALGLFQSQAEINSWADQDQQGNATIQPGDIKYLDFNKDGTIDAKDVHVIGRGFTPDIMLSFNLNLQYKGFDLSALFQGASAFNAYYHQNPFENGTVPFTFMSDYWTPTNTDAKYPRLVAGEAENNKAISSFWLMDATYLRLKNLTLGYTIPERLITKMHINTFRIYITGLDILTFDNVSPLDPESGASLMANGVSPYPKMKNIQVGIDLRF